MQNQADVGIFPEKGFYFHQMLKGATIHHKSRTLLHLLPGT